MWLSNIEKLFAFKNEISAPILGNDFFLPECFSKRVVFATVFNYPINEEFTLKTTV
jgi:hypothetical protein